MVSFGWKAGAEQYGPRELLDMAVAAEESGFDLVSISDHFHPWDESGQSPFAWTWLGAAAARTSRVRLGTGLTAPILRYHPAIIAQAVATLAELAPGRAFIAVGTGEALNEYSATGLWPGHRGRQRRVEDAVSLMRELFAGEPVSHRGRYYQTHAARLYTCPPKAPPIYVGSSVPASARFAGRIGDGLLTVGGKEPAFYRELLGEFEAGAREAGKDPASLPRAIELSVSYGNPRDRALAAKKQFWAGAMVPALFRHRIYTPAESAANGAVVGEDVMAKAMFSDDPAEHVAFARAFLDLGFTDLVFHSPGPDQRAFIAGYGRDVLPRLREAVRSRAA
ncbi:MAG: TIGR03557 family F420-dependent LLM class oxidoreductase [Dehalococcoidia bacterium]|nr:TIGR03557 family F420-dependent LLM class oxidoreductase [Dehalococcoidia bacterium]